MRVLVLGGGPAGVTAALQAAELGAQVTLVERRRVGGTALNDGPARVRTLARAARLVRDWSSWETFGLRGPRPQVDLAAALANAERVARYAHERKHLSDHIRAVNLVEEAGDVRFLDAKTVAATDGRVWTADRIILAVGRASLAAADPGRRAGFDLPGHTVVALPARPRRRHRRGGYGLPAHLDPGRLWLSRLAARAWARLVPRADEHISAGLEQAFGARGIQVVTSASAERLEPLGTDVGVAYRTGEETRTVGVEAATFAVGWSGNWRCLWAQHADPQRPPRGPRGGENAVLGPRRRIVLHGGQDARGGGRRAAARLPHLHRGRRHGRTDEVWSPLSYCPRSSLSAKVLAWLAA